MTERGGKFLLTAEALLLLLPLTLLTALIVLLSYPAYPIPNPGLFQNAFDAAMLIAVEHMLNPRTAEDYVGFALLAPAVALVPISIHLLTERCRA